VTRIDRVRADEWRDREAHAMVRVPLTDYRKQKDYPRAVAAMGRVLALSGGRCLR
jgi:hypothetical protein